jgi:hypothetical protein
VARVIASGPPGGGYVAKVLVTDDAVVGDAQEGEARWKKLTLMPKLSSAGPQSVSLPEPSGASYRLRSRIFHSWHRPRAPAVTSRIDLCPVGMGRTVGMDRAYADSPRKGVKGDVWFSLIDKVYAQPTLSAAWTKVRANAGAAGIDAHSAQMFERQAD